MTKTSNAAKDRWNAKTYDDLRIRIPKGRKNDVEAYAKHMNVSVNSLVNNFLRQAIGMTDEDWKKNASDGDT